MAIPKLLVILSENWTLVGPRDLQTLVDWAVAAEDEGIDGVMISEHVVMGPTAGDQGRMENPREYAYPGNQDPATPWPGSLMLLSAIASRTTQLRLVAGAIIAPLRHPLLLASDIATLDVLSQGRLVIQPTVSWHKDEYDALGVPFNKRGAILDEQLAVWETVWREAPASFQGEFFQFHDVSLEPRCWRRSGPQLWFGGQSLHPPLLRRLLKYGTGFHPLGAPSEEDLQTLTKSMLEAGRDMSELDMVGGTRAVFPDATSPADLDAAMESIRPQWERGFKTFCIKPNQFIDDPAQLPGFFREIVRRTEVDFV